MGVVPGETTQGHTAGKEPNRSVVCRLVCVFFFSLPLEKYGYGYILPAPTAAYAGGG